MVTFLKEKVKEKHYADASTFSTRDEGGEGVFLAGGDLSGRANSNLFRGDADRLAALITSSAAGECALDVGDDSVAIGGRAISPEEPAPCDE